MKTRILNIASIAAAWVLALSSLLWVSVPATAFAQQAIDIDAKK